MKRNIIISILSLLCFVLFSIEIVEAQLLSYCDYNKNQYVPFNFKKVSDKYYRSGIIHKCDYAVLRKLGIKTIIDLRENFFGHARKEKIAANKVGINYFNIPISPFLPPNNEEINKFFSIVDDENNQPVLVHCLHGMDRTGIMVALLRIRNNHCSYDKAYEEMLNNGYHQFRYPLLKKFLQKYAKENP